MIGGQAIAALGRVARRVGMLAQPPQHLAAMLGQQRESLLVCD
jgi:hypothetical protein